MTAFSQLNVSYCNPTVRQSSTKRTILTLQGAGFGWFFSTILICWLHVGSLVTKNRTEPLPLSVDGCVADPANLTWSAITSYNAIMETQGSWDNLKELLGQLQLGPIAGAFGQAGGLSFMCGYLVSQIMGTQYQNEYPRVSSTKFSEPNGSYVPRSWLPPDKDTGHFSQVLFAQTNRSNDLKIATDLIIQHAMSDCFPTVLSQTLVNGLSAASDDEALQLSGVIQQVANGYGAHVGHPCLGDIVHTLLSDPEARYFYWTREHFGTQKEWRETLHDTISNTPELHFALRNIFLCVLSNQGVREWLYRTLNPLYISPGPQVRTPALISDLCHVYNNWQKLGEDASVLEEVLVQLDLTRAHLEACSKDMDSAVDLQKLSPDELAKVRAALKMIKFHQERKSRITFNEDAVLEHLSRAQTDLLSNTRSYELELYAEGFKANKQYALLNFMIAMFSRPASTRQKRLDWPWNWISSNGDSTPAPDDDPTSRQHGQDDTGVSDADDWNNSLDQEQEASGVGDNEAELASGNFASDPDLEKLNPESINPGRDPWSEPDDDRDFSSGDGDFSFEHPSFPRVGQVLDSDLDDADSAGNVNVNSPDSVWEYSETDHDAQDFHTKMHKSPKMDAEGPTLELEEGPSSSRDAPNIPDDGHQNPNIASQHDTSNNTSNDISSSELPNSSLDSSHTGDYENATGRSSWGLRYENNESLPVQKDPLNTTEPDGVKRTQNGLFAVDPLEQEPLQNSETNNTKNSVQQRDYSTPETSTSDDDDDDGGFGTYERGESTTEDHSAQQGSSLTPDTTTSSHLEENALDGAESTFPRDLTESLDTATSTATSGTLAETRGSTELATPTTHSPSSVVNTLDRDRSASESEPKIGRAKPQPKQPRLRKFQNPEYRLYLYHKIEQNILATTLTELLTGSLSRNSSVFLLQTLHQVLFGYGSISAERVVQLYIRSGKVLEEQRDEGSVQLRQQFQSWCTAMRIQASLTWSCMRTYLLQLRPGRFILHLVRVVRGPFNPDVRHCRSVRQLPHL